MNQICWTQLHPLLYFKFWCLRTWEWNKVSLVLCGHFRSCIFDHCWEILSRIFILISCPRHHLVLLRNLGMCSLLMATTVPSFSGPLSWNREDNHRGCLVEKKHIQAVSIQHHLCHPHTLHIISLVASACDSGCACWQLSSLPLVPGICRHPSLLLSVKRPTGVPLGIWWTGRNTDSYSPREGF